MIPDVAGPAIARVHADLRELFARIGELAPGVPAPRVTLDLPASEPEPLHVFAWGTARDFGIAGLLSGNVCRITFHVWVTVVATASTPEDAARIANAYQAVALQVPLVDTQLGGAVEEIGAPQVKEADAWGDADGRRHAGYLLDFEAAVHVSASPEARDIIEEMTL
ncbi:hypothetical protein C1876_02885 [Eggerthella sinensis]|uniref:Uncharacterized protein n=1 Tax=Eggerthella sinensis TaxID=242230 RepID=A0A3N0IUY9_9ACTN|nr:hypothetical protein C1876_02885 [Eggerthella sinensis]RNM40783.1 hypothetical protein DMP09_12820 [Eggerthella sinensis]